MTERQVTEFPFRICGAVGVAARIFGVRIDRARATISGETLTVRYGRWVVTTALANISAVEVTGPYRTWKVAGPPHLSFADAGLTFATNGRRGVRIAFHDPVPGLLPFGLVPHPSLTFTVASPDAFAVRLRQFCPALT